MTLGYKVSMLMTNDCASKLTGIKCSRNQVYDANWVTLAIARHNLNLSYRTQLPLNTICHYFRLYK